MFSFDRPRPRRAPSLTPMIDVVFLLLVFFMLATRFGAETAVPLALGGDSGLAEGPPRLVDIGPAEVRLNGIVLADAALAGAVAEILPDPEMTVVLRPAQGASLQRLIGITELLRSAGYSNLAVVEGG